MASNAEKAGAMAGTDLRNSDPSKINSEHIRLENLRAQYLSEVFALPACTAAVIAELAFPEAPHA
jgi:hypothetical protein